MRGGKSIGIFVGRNLKNCDIQDAARDLRMRSTEQPPAHLQSLLQVGLGGGVFPALDQVIAEHVHRARDIGIVAGEELAVDSERFALGLDRATNVPLERSLGLFKQDLSGPNRGGARKVDVRFGGDGRT